jgi:hypothetical protein
MLQTRTFLSSHSYLRTLACQRSYWAISNAVWFTTYFDTKTFLPGTQDTADVTWSVIALEYCDGFLDECQQCWTDTQIRQSDRTGQYIAEGSGLFQWKGGPWKADSCRPTWDTVIKHAFAGMAFSIISVAIFQPHTQGPFRHADLHEKIRN